MADSATDRPLSKAVQALHIVLALVPAIILAVSWSSLPETIPAHWGASGIDRWGSKLELLVVPALSVVLGIVFLIAMRRAHENDRVSFLSGQLSERTVMTVAGVLISLVCIVTMGVWIFSITGETAAPDPSLTSAFAWQTIGLPAFMLLAGVMLSLRSIGVPAEDDLLAEQYHAQRIAGAVLAIAGVIMAAICGLLVSGTQATVCQAIIVAIAFIFDFVLLRPWL